MKTHDATARWRKAAALLLGTGLLFGATPLLASVVDPPVTFTSPPFSGNPVVCGAPEGQSVGLGYSFGHRLDQSVLVSGQSYPISVNGNLIGSVTPTIIPGNGINWTSTFPIDAVIMKGGAAANVYPYVKPPTPPAVAGVNWNTRPYPGALTADNALYTPGQGISHIDFCFSPRPTAHKTAEASWKRYTDWTLDKSVTPTSISMFDGDSHDAEYTVEVVPTTRGSYTVKGTITVKDPFGIGWEVTNVADVMQFNNSATQFQLAWDGPGGNADTLSCSKPAPNPDKVILTCSYEFNLESTAHPFLLTATGGVNSAGITTRRPGSCGCGDDVPDGEGGTAIQYVFSTTANFAIPANPAESYGDTLSVDDSMLPGNPDHVFNRGGSYSWTYTRTFTCDADEGEKNNTATGTWSTGPSTSGTASDSAKVTVNCETVTVSKTAVTRYTRDFEWTPAKWVVVTPADFANQPDGACQAAPLVGGPYAGNYLCKDVEVELNPGGSYDTVYLLQASKSVQDERDFAVSGSINVSWPAGLTPVFNPPTPSDTLTFTDAANGTQPVTPTCGAQGATSLACTYDAALPRDFVPGYNEARIDRVKQCYDAQGNATACGTRTYVSNQAPLQYAANADTNVDACADLSDLFNGIAGLNGGGSFGWSLGNQCDSFSGFYTGDVIVNGMLVGNLGILADWLLPSQVDDGSCKFYVPNLLTVATAGDGARNDEATVHVAVPEACVQDGCTYTQGYWKTHSKYGPAPYDATWALIGEDTLFFSSGKSWYQAFWTPPTGGNAYYILAHQYMAARLNVLAGAGVPANVQSAIDQATAWFTGRSPAAPKGAARTTAINLAGILAAYNEGTIGPGHCSVSPQTLKQAN